MVLPRTLNTAAPTTPPMRREHILSIAVVLAAVCVPWGDPWADASSVALLAGGWSCFQSVWWRLGDR